MDVQVPLGLWFAVVGAAIVVAGVVIVGVWRAPAGDARVPVVAGLSIWLAVDVVLAAFGVFEASDNRQVPVIAFGLAVPLVAGIWLLGRPGSLSRLVDSVPLRWLIGVQLYRAAGVLFLVAWAQGLMPGAFALPAGLGDIAVGLAAPFVAARLVDGSDRSHSLGVAWNIAGIADLVLAVTLGFLTSPSPFQQLALNDPNRLITRLPFVLIPTFAVPLSILLHVAALRRLRTWSRSRQPAMAR